MDTNQTITLFVGAVVFKDGCILLVQRKNPPNANQWALPGGKVHYGENLRAAVAREIKEETGITIEALEPVYTFEIIGNFGDEDYHYVIIDYSTNYITGDIKANDDALSAAWVSRDEFNKLAVNSVTVDLLRDKFEYP